MPTRSRRRIRAAAPVRVPSSSPKPGPEAAPAPPILRRVPAPPLPDHLDRARRLGHRPEDISRQIAAARMGEGAPLGALQRVKILDRLTPTGRRSKKGRKLRLTGPSFDDLHKRVEFKMYTLKLGPRGSKGKFKDFLRKDREFDSEGEMIRSFLRRAVRENDRVVALRLEARRKRSRYKRLGIKKKVPRVTGWTRPLKLNRIPWTDEHKTMSLPGQDIRHIVRNATLKAPLEAEYDHWKSVEDKTLAFRTISGYLGLETEGLHPWVMMKNAYSKLYLHKGNLFGGPSAVNRVIGLSADDLRNEGKVISEAKGTPTKKDVSEALTYVLNKVEEQVRANQKKASKLSKKAEEEFLRNLDEMVKSIKEYLNGLSQAWNERVDKGTLGFQEMGATVIEIGDNFGFDMIVEEGGGNVGNVKERQGILVKVELALSEYKPGNPQQLGEIFAAFLKA